MPQRPRLARTLTHAATAVTTAVAFAGVACAAGDEPAAAGGALDAVVVTGATSGGAARASEPAATSMSGARLDARRASTLGETLSQEPGVSSTYYGPNASRPVIRGQDADRVRIVENGSAVVDASSLSPDHASATEPLLAERIDVLRGPDALRFGPATAGGVVSVRDNRIPASPVEGVEGRAELRAGGAQSETAGVAAVDAGDGRLAVHADAFARSAGDARIPGYARSASQRAIDAATSPGMAQPYGRIPNSFARSEGGALGASITGAGGYVGASVSALRSTYGTPAETDTKIDLRKDTLGFAGEARALGGALKSVRFGFAGTDYEHQEKDKGTGVVSTTFRGRGFEGRVEAEHADLGPVRGSFGAQLGRLDFSALGAEAYVPSTRTDTAALFVLERWDLQRLRLSAGGRVEQARVESAGDQSQPGADRFGPPQSRSFATRNLSLAATYRLVGPWSLYGQAARGERAPTSYELFANGPHAATGTYEVGDASLSREASTTLEAALRYEDGPRRLSLGAWQSRFGNYLMLSPTGRMRSTSGGFEDPSTPGYTPSGDPANLPEYRYLQVPATFRGVEASARWPLPVDAVKLDGELRVDYLRASQTDTGAPLPRIAPARVALSLVHQANGRTLRADLVHAFAQDRTAPNETPTPSYTLLNLYASWRVSESARAAWEVFARADNLFDQDARVHSSLIKEIAPLPGRSLLVGVRTLF